MYYYYVTVPELDKDEHKGAILTVNPRKLVVLKAIEIVDCFPQGLARGRFPSGRARSIRATWRVADRPRYRRNAFPRC
jgi:hypothetical protein